MFGKVTISICRKLVLIFHYLCLMYFTNLFLQALPTQENWYDCGLFVFHYGYAVGRWYHNWRCKHHQKSLVESVTGSSYFNKDPDLAIDLRHQISALILSFDEIYDGHHDDKYISSVDISQKRPNKCLMSHNDII